MIEGLDEPLLPKHWIPEGYVQHWDTVLQRYVIVSDRVNIRDGETQTHVKLVSLKR
jgi:hypothetical protein